MPRRVDFSLTPEQKSLVESSLQARQFLEGPAGSGKSTVGIERMVHLLERGVRGDSILVLAPQRSLAGGYYAALEVPGVVSGGPVQVLTLGGLARRTIELFWPVAAGPAGFRYPDHPPGFLTMESAQYFMRRIASPLLERGYFASLVIDRNRLFAQVLDNLNKSALVGFPYTEIGERLTSAWTGERAQEKVYANTQECASLFRAYCLEHNLLDFSLQIEVFRNILWKHSACKTCLLESTRHMIFDNIEEETPFAFDLLSEWLPELDSALLIYDLDAGYRRFLGADPELTYTLKAKCELSASLERSFVCSAPVKRLEEALPYGFKRSNDRVGTSPAPTGEQKNEFPDPSGYRPAFDYPKGEIFRFHNEMLEWAAKAVECLVKEEGIPPGEIAVLSPFLSDALRFSVLDRLMARGVPARSHRPSRALRDEPASQCLVTLAALAHPGWGIKPAAFDTVYALIEAVEGMDLVRARLLTEKAYRPRTASLAPFEEIDPTTQQRITYTLGGRYDRLRTWLLEYAQGEPEALDVFFSRLFGEVLSQPGFRFHGSFQDGETTANLIDSAADFRRITAGCPSDQPPGKEYLEMVADGVVAATYVRSWQPETLDEVLVSPAHTFLLSNRPVDVQVWLDLPSRGWFERLEQPLTHPYVLSREWRLGDRWTYDDEYRQSQESMYRLALGLVRRCRKRIYLGFSALNEQGYEQQGPLMRVFQRLITAGFEERKRG